MDSSVIGLLIALLFDIILLLIEIIIFIVYRTYRSRPIYMDAEKEIKTTVFSEGTTPLKQLLYEVWTIPFNDISDYCGVEAKLFLTLHLVLCIALIPIAILNCGILLPLYALGDNYVEFELDYIGIAHILNNDDALFLPVLLVAVVSVAMYITIYHYVKLAYTKTDSWEEVTISLDKYIVEIYGI